MRILAVTACPTGIAHTYMAAEQLEIAARRAGLPIKVETQGALGIENRLSQRDLHATERVLIAADIEILDWDRFRHKRLVKVPIQAAIDDPDNVLARYLA